ncbi:hypothetical protein WIS52_04210 [Pseudonocardia nematodicida]|uniref:Uncharacterized protein n=1 Tax=Pseudonocardia nematodicida TaxID=1206997 RepID=A0ABV1K5F2_9PSEU
MSERLTVSFDSRIAARVRACAATTRGGASGYLARLVADDQLREAGESMARWYAANPTFLEDAVSEREAAEGSA